MTVVNTGDRSSSRIVAARTAAAASVVLACSGLALLVAQGRADHITEGFVAHFALIAVGFGVLAWLAVPRQPDNRAVWVGLWAAALSGLGVAAWYLGVLVLERSGFDTSREAWTALTPEASPAMAAAFQAAGFVLLVNVPFIILIFGFLLFPDGRLLSRGWAWVAWAAGVAMIMGMLLVGWEYRPSSTVTYGHETPWASPLGIIYLTLIALSLVAVFGLVVGYRRSSGAARRQYRWIGWGGGAFLVLFNVFIDQNPTAPEFLATLLGVALLILSYGVAVTRYRLYDIDVVISRTVVYGTLAVFIGAVYVLVVVVVGELLGSETGNLGLAIAATALVAVAFEPLRHRAQRWANRLVYGKRASPYEVLSKLTHRLAGAEPAEGLLERMARLLAEGTGAEQATVWLADRRGRLESATGWPGPSESGRVTSVDDLEGFVSAVFHDDELVGVLEVIKARGNPVTPSEQRLIEDLAGSAGLVLGNQRLNAALGARAAELQESRRRLVEMQDLERRRLERDLHDGAQQEVVALKLKIGLAERVARNGGAEELAAALAGLASEAQEAVDEIRRLARGIYPPLLESEDLATAISSQALAMTVPVEVRNDGIGRYPRDVESALYFSALEAIANATRHGAPSRIVVALGNPDGFVELDVSDDGTGFDANGTHEGTGLINIRDRVEALGGELAVSSMPGDGTLVSVRIPVPDLAAEEAHAVVGVV